MSTDSCLQSDSQVNLTQASSIAQTLPVTVITTCYGRNRHLYNLLTSLATGSMKPAEVIIVNDDADQSRLDKFDLNIVKIATTLQLQQEAQATDVVSINTGSKSGNQAGLGFDIGRNRNLGASQAHYEMLIFLDVDCIPSYRFVEGLTDKLMQHPKALLMAQPCYLTRPLTPIESAKLAHLEQDAVWLQTLSILNPYRHNLISKELNNKSAKDSDDNNEGNSTGIEQTDDYGAFWSLCFAITQVQFQSIGGFDTHYVGYGAEDTDFAFMTRQLGVSLYLTNDIAYHQQHGVYRPPLNHLSSIVLNANRFYDKWQHWAMGGWLASFVDMGLIEWVAEQNYPITLLRQPTNKEIQAAHYPGAAFV